MPLYNTIQFTTQNHITNTHHQSYILPSNTISFAFFLSSNKGEKMNHNGHRTPNLELKLNLSPPRSYIVKGQDYYHFFSSPNTTLTSSMEMSPPSSCGSSNLSPDRFCYPSSPDEAKSMMLVACPQCLMYVMSSREDPKCPKCKTTVLLDFLRDEMANAKRIKRNARGLSAMFRSS